VRGLKPNPHTRPGWVQNYTRSRHSAHALGAPDLLHRSTTLRNSLRFKSHVFMIALSARKRLYSRARARGAPITLLKPLGSRQSKCRADVLSAVASLCTTGTSRCMCAEGAAGCSPVMNSKPPTKNRLKSGLSPRGGVGLEN